MLDAAGAATKKLKSTAAVLEKLLQPNPYSVCPLSSPLEMESSVVTMYGFRLNPRETSYVVDRVLSTTNCVSPLMVRAYVGGLLEQDPMYEEMYVQLVAPEQFPDDLHQIPSTYPYMLVFGLTVGQGTTHQQLRQLYERHSMFHDIRPLRRWFREVFDLRLQFTSDQAGIYSGYGLPDMPLGIQRAGVPQIT